MPQSNTNLNSTSARGDGVSREHNIESDSEALGCYIMNLVENNYGGSSSGSSVKAKIMAHPLYPRLLAAYVNCQKVGAPPAAVATLHEAHAAAVTTAMSCKVGGSCCAGEDPALDQFMEAYCELLTKYEQELSKPLEQAVSFLQTIELQFKALTVDSPISFACNGNTESSEDEMDVENNRSMVDPQADDKELKDRLLLKYSGYLGGLKQEFMKKRKKGNLPKEARQQLLDWWNGHLKWPYPSESQKLALAESTGLDLKKINNWFINQRKRHWKPLEDMQFMVVDPLMHTHHYLMDNVLASPHPCNLSHIEGKPRQ